MLTDQDLIEIASVVKGAGGGEVVEHSLKETGAGFRFDLMCGEEKAIAVCEALVDAGVQHSTRDEKPEYKLIGTNGASLVTVIWTLLDLTLPVFAGDTLAQTTNG